MKEILGILGDIDAKLVGEVGVGIKKVFNYLQYFVKPLCFVAWFVILWEGVKVGI